MRPASLLVALGAVLWASDSDGIRPRAAAADYPAHTARDAVSIGADLLAPDQVRKIFVSDLHRAYVVVEVALYPSRDLDLEWDAFQLRLSGTQKSVRPASPRAVASALQKTAPSQSDVTLYPTVGVSYESGPRTYDPATGGTRGGGWRTNAGVGVGVGVGSTRPASTEPDRRTMEIELSEKGLPEGAFSKPIAGYLYFPLAPGKKSSAYELEYDSPAGRVVLKLK